MTSDLVLPAPSPTPVVEGGFISFRRSALERPWVHLVPTLCVGTPLGTLSVPFRLQRRALEPVGGLAALVGLTWAGVKDGTKTYSSEGGGYRRW
jgi:hypothetical protein